MVDVSDIGRRLAPVTAHVEPGRLRFFRRTLGETNPVYCDPESARSAGFRDLPVPPTYLFCLEMMDADDPFAFLEELRMDISRILHGEQSFSYLAPVCVGDTLTFRTAVGDVTEKKGGALTLVTMTTEIVNQAGLDVARATRVLVVRNG